MGCEDTAKERDANTVQYSCCTSGAVPAWVMISSRGILGTGEK